MGRCGVSRRTISICDLDSDAGLAEIGWRVLGSVGMDVSLSYLLAWSVLLVAWFPLRSRGAVEDWPRFRGPGGSGLGKTDFPVYFGVNSNVLWKADLPPGHSSPSISGEQIFLSGFRDGLLEVCSLRRSDGGMLWRRQFEPGAIERGAQLSDPAAATPATDGERVFTYFGAFGLVCHALDGAEVWRKPLPVPVLQHGSGTSPVLAGGALVLNVDQDVGSYLLAVDKRDGRTLWRVAREGFRRGFSTPLSWPPERPEQLIVPGTLRLVSYNLADGSERWSVRGLPNEMVASPVAGGGLIFVAGWTYGSGVVRMPEFASLLAAGDRNRDGMLTREEAPEGPAKRHFQYIDADKDGRVSATEYGAIARAFDESKNVALAVRPDGRGDVTDTHVVWRAFRGLPYVPSPLYYEGRLYLVKNGGLASCFDAATGRVLYQEERLGALGDYAASPVASAGKICVVSQNGVAVIYRAGDTLEVLARHPLGEPVLATPAILDGTLYLRTRSKLYAFRDVSGSAGRTVSRPATTVLEKTP